MPDTQDTLFLRPIFEGERYSDFALLWLVFHQSRLEPQDDRIDRCWLEQWFALSRTEGLQALDDLRDGALRIVDQGGNGGLHLLVRQPAELKLALLPRVVV